MSLENLKQKIKEEIPISTIIGHYLSIKRMGSSQVSLCPFHGDTKPSMNINDSKKIFKCFACGASGDGIGFVMKYRNLDFIQAMKEICERQGISFESYQEEKKLNPKVEMGKKILTRAALLYRKMATSNAFLPYKNFIATRGLNEETASTYSLGFAPNKNSISDYLHSIPDQKERDFALSVALDLGIIRKDKNNPEAHYDTFRDRIIFPIWDHLGQVTGFTSRAIREDQKAKYMNSVESFIFHKGHILYGLHLAKNSIRERDAVILVEGNMDQIALFHHGFTNAVAIMGTALGASSMERLLSLTKNIYLAMDSDKAGLVAMKRINSELAEKGVVAKFLEFSPEKDPDDYLKVQGPLALQKKIENAVPAFDFLLNDLLPEKIPEVLDRKLELLTRAFELIAPLKNSLAATERIASFAKRIGLKSEPAQIVSNYQEYLNKAQEKAKPAPAFKKDSPPFVEDLPEMAQEADLSSQAEAYASFLEGATSPHIHMSKMERLLVQELVQLPSLLNLDKLNEILDLVTNDEVKKYIGKIRKITMEVDDSEYESVVLNLTNVPEYSVDLREAVSSAFYNYRPNKPNEANTKTKLKILFDLKNKLMTEQLKNKKDEIKKLQLACTSEDEMVALLQKLSGVEKEIQKLKNLRPEKSTHREF